MNGLIKSTQLWAIDKGLHEANPTAQLTKIMEELGEVTQAYTRKDKENLLMEIGDLLVTVIIFAQQNNIEPELALRKAYAKINGRKGKLIGGSFIKQEDIEVEKE